MVKFLLKIFLFIGIALVGCSCSIAPFAPTNTARSLGAGNAGLATGKVNGSYYMRAAAGISPNMDLGYTMEFGNAFSTSGIYTKFSLINNPIGPSFAFSAGYGSGDTSKHYYGGLTGSLAITQSLEFFVDAKYNWASVNEKDIDINEPIGNFKLLSSEAKYTLLNFGFNVWVNPLIGLNIFGTRAYGRDIAWENGPVFGAGILLRI